jgi:class 3 adenylate cyclase/CHASE2 domain-containing sensor protein
MWIATGVVGLVCLAQALVDRAPGLNLLRRLEWLSYDWRVRHAAKSPHAVTPNLAFVGIDDDSLYWLGEGRLLGDSYGLLWPRQVYGRLVRELAAQGASRVALDVLFGELRPDHDSPGIELLDRTRVGSDQFFAEQLRRAGNVVLAAEGSVIPAVLFRTNAFAVGDIANKPDSDGILRQVPAFQTYYAWDPLFANLARKYEKKLLQQPRLVQFLNAATGQPELSVSIDEQGFYKQEDLTGKKEQGFSRLRPAYTALRVWHMGILLAARELDLDLDHPTLEPGRIVLRGRAGVERIIPVDAQGRFYVNWRLLPNDPRLTEANIENLLGQDLLRTAGQTAALTNRFRNTLVTVGSAATGSNLADLGATPLSSKTLLVSTHWNVANMLITGQFIRRPGLGMELALILGLGALSAVLSWRVRALWASMAVALLLAAYLAVAFFLFVRSRYWLPVVLPAGGALFLTHLCLVIYRSVFEQNEQRRIRQVFAKIVSPSVVQELLRAKKLSLGGARRRVTVFFADIRGFTELTELHHARAERYVLDHQLAGPAAEAHFDTQARQLLETVNLYLSLVAETVKQREGTLDKYIGDCVMAFWGAPALIEKHALSAVRAAIAVQQAVEALNLQRADENRRREAESLTRVAQGQPPLPLLDVLHVGCGLNTGVVTVGLMGSDAHLLNYTVFGREVNVANRIESVSGRGHILVGESTYREILRCDPDLASTCIELPPLTVKGIRTPVNVFEVAWKATPARLRGEADAQARPE